MATKSDVLPIATTLGQIALCGVGKEVVVFGLVFANTTAATRTVTLSIYRQATGGTVEIPWEIAAKAHEAWPKPIALQPGDHLDVKADAVGVNLLWSLDEDDGVNPVSSGFVPRGVYSAGATYQINHAVSFGTGSYVSTVNDNIGNSPDTSPAQWMSLVNATVPPTRSITGGGLAQGGGDLSQDRVITVSAAVAATVRGAVSKTQVMTVGDTYEGLAEVPLYVNAGTVVTGSAAGTDLNMDAFVHASMTVSANQVLPNPANARPGKTGRLRFISGGNFTQSYGGNWHFEGQLPVMPTVAGQVMIIEYDVITSNYIWAKASKPT